MPYDYLVLAAGAVSSDFGVPGVDRARVPVEDADGRDPAAERVLSRFEEANADPSLLNGEPVVTDVGVSSRSSSRAGGRPAWSCRGALAELFARVLAKDFKQLDVDAGEGRARRDDRPPARRVPAAVAAGSGGGARGSRGRAAAGHIDRAGARRSASISPTGRRSRVGPCVGCGRDGQPARGHARTGDLGARRDRGRPRSERPGHPEVFVIGDLAAAADRHGPWLPQLAPVAMQAGRHTAHTIGARARRQGPPAVPLRRQGDHGDDRAAVGGRRAPVRHPVPGHARLAELARPAPRVPHRLPQPSGRPRQLDVELLQVGPRAPGDPHEPEARSPTRDRSRARGFNRPSTKELRP